MMASSGELHPMWKWIPVTAHAACSTSGVMLCTMRAYRGSLGYTSLMTSGQYGMAARVLSCSQATCRPNASPLSRSLHRLSTFGHGAVRYSTWHAESSYVQRPSGSCSLIASRKRRLSGTGSPARIKKSSSSMPIQRWRSRRHAMRCSGFIVHSLLLWFWMS